MTSAVGAKRVPNTVAQTQAVAGESGGDAVGTPPPVIGGPFPGGTPADIDPNSIHITPLEGTETSPGGAPVVIGGNESRFKILV